MARRPKKKALRKSIQGPKFKYYFNEAIEPALVFAPLCALLGIIAASAYHTVDFTTGLLLILGVLFAQMSVNVLNDYVDYKRGIDQETTATKFSGGKKLIVDGRISPGGTLAIGIISFIIAAAISLNFAISNPIIIPYIVVGAVSILLYTSWLLYIPFAAEPIVIMNFMMISMASFIVAGSSTLHMATAILLAFPAGAVIGMALLINEMPDRKIDAAHGRKSGAVMLKSNANNAQYYVFWQVASYLAIIFGVIYKVLPVTELIAIGAAPLMIVCVKGMLDYSNPKEFEKFMGLNAIYCILFICLLIAGYIIAIV